MDFCFPLDFDLKQSPKGQGIPPRIHKSAVAEPNGALPFVLEEHSDHDNCGEGTHPLHLASGMLGKMLENFRILHSELHPSGVPYFGG